MDNIEFEKGIANFLKLRTPARYERKVWKALSAKIDPRTEDYLTLRQVPHHVTFYKDVPINIFDIDIDYILEAADPRDRKKEKSAYNKIRNLLKAGKPPWPVIVDANTGALIDGWHRLAAMTSLGFDLVDVFTITYLM